MRLIDADALVRRYVGGTVFVTEDELENAPTVDAVEIPPECREAVEMFLAFYREGLGNKFIHRPISWALHSTWQAMTAKEPERDIWRDGK